MLSPNYPILRAEKTRNRKRFYQTILIIKPKTITQTVLNPPFLPIDTKVIGMIRRKMKWLSIYIQIY